MPQSARSAYIGIGEFDIRKLVLGFPELSKSWDTSHQPHVEVQGHR